MSYGEKRSPGYKKHPANVFLLLTAVFLLGLLPAVYAKTKQTEIQPSIQATPGQTSRTYIQQIGPAGDEETEETINVYGSVPANKSLLTSSRFRVIDDFNSGSLKNQFGDDWKIHKEKAKKAEVKIIKEDGRGVRSGHSLQMQFDLQKREQFE